MKKILIIDDDAAFDIKLAEKLRLAGLEPLITVTGQEALDFLKDNDVDFIILDFVMPKMDGEEFFQKLRHDIRKNIPTVVLTNLSRMKDTKDFEVYVKSETDLDDFVAKIKSRVSAE